MLPLPDFSRRLENLLYDPSHFLPGAGLTHGGPRRAHHKGLQLQTQHTLRDAEDPPTECWTILLGSIVLLIIDQVKLISKSDQAVGKPAAMGLSCGSRSTATQGGQAMATYDVVLQNSIELVAECTLAEYKRAEKKPGEGITRRIAE